MGDDHEGAGEGVEDVLDGGQGVGVQVVGGLVEQEHIGLGHEQAQELEPAALPAADLPDPGPGALTGEAQALDELGRRHLLVPDDDPLPHHGHGLDDAQVRERVELVGGLGQGGHLDGLAAGDAALSGLLDAFEQAQQGGLAGTVDADDADALAGREPPGDAAQDLPLGRLAGVSGRPGVAHGDVLQVEDLLAQAGGGHGGQGHGVARGRHVGDEGLGGIDAEAGLGGAGGGAATQPGQLLAQEVLPLDGGHGGLAGALGPGQDVGGVPAVVGLDAAGHLGAPAAGVDAGDDLPHVGADGVQEPAVVGNGDQGAGGPATRAVEAGPQVAGEPVHALDVEVVGGLVEDDDVGAAGEDRGQGDAAALAPGEGGDVGGQVEVGDEAGVDVTHGRVGGPLVLGGLAVDGGAHGGARRQVVGLAQDRHAHAAGAGDAAAVGLAPTGQGRQEGGLAGAVGA